MRRAPKVDANQAEIVAALRGVGASVQHLHGVGSGCPDILVGYQHRNILMEIKDGSKPPSKRALNPDQEEWFDAWRGAACVVTSVDEALVVLGVQSRVENR